jgi:hypothetical protein
MKNHEIHSCVPLSLKFPPQHWAHNNMSKGGKFDVGDLALCAETNGLYYVAKLKESRITSGQGTNPFFK